MSDRRIPISQLEATSTAPDSSYLAIDDGSLTKKITVEDFNATSTASAQSYAEQAQDIADAVAENIAISAGQIRDATLAAREAVQASDAAALSATEAQDYSTQAQNYATNAALYAEQALSGVDTAGQESTNSRSWAVGGTGTRVGEDTDNAKYYAEQAYESASGVGADADRAEAAREAIEDMGVEAVTLTPGSSATATKAVDPMTGAVTITFGLPQGAKGDQGDEGPAGDPGEAVYDVIFTCPCVVIPCDDTGKVKTGGFSVDIDYRAYHGDMTVASTFSRVANVPSNMTVTNLSNATAGTRGQIRVTCAAGSPVDTSDITDYFYVEFTIDGHTITKTMQWVAVNDGEGGGSSDTFDHLTVGSRISGSTIGQNSLTNGSSNTASGMYSFASGVGTQATTTAAHAEGSGTTASSANSHSEGAGTTASGANSHAEGGGSTASGTGAHAEGGAARAVGANSHAEGGASEAYGIGSHAEGDRTYAGGNFSHAEGSETYASGIASHAEGIGTRAIRNYQHVSGKYNIEDTANAYAEIVGNGTDANNRSNAYTLNWNGNATYAGKVTAGAGPTENMDLTTKQYVDAAAGDQVVYVNGADPVINAEAGKRYVCNSQINSLTFTPPASGLTDVTFLVGTNGATVTLPSTVLMPAWYEIKANTRYEISILDGIYGVVMTWPAVSV